MNEAGLRRAVGLLLDSRAFAGPFGAAEERSLIRDVESLLPRFLPAGMRAVVRCSDEELPEGVGAVLEIVLMGGPKRVRTLRFDLTSF